jgi:hypothetical protein
MEIKLEDRRNDTYKKKLYDRLARVCYKMHDRCNNPKQKCYVNYGGRGVTYCDKWAHIVGFIDDVDKIPGWDEEKFMNHELQLDKDFRVPGSKLYSLDTCLWISRQQNMKKQPSRQKPFTAYNLITKEYKHGTMKKEFAKKNNLCYTVVLNVLKHKKHRAGNWVLWYDDDPNKPNLNDPIFYKYRNYGKTKLNV